MNAKQVAFTIKTSKPVPQAVEALTEALKLKTFGVLSNLNISKIIKEKTGKVVDDYVILDICNAKDADYALSVHKEIGLILPCKIIVYKDKNETVISLYRLTEALKAIGFSDLNAFAEEVECRLRQAIDSAVA
jgi:uncharacterized protein (DUF302 family)